MGRDRQVEGLVATFHKIESTKNQVRREAVLEWLRARSFASTAEYETGHGPGRPRKEAADAA